jgi:cell pole-organizing protein PopZ
MSNAAKAQEPTMEEILASIRRIIADDAPAAEAAAAAKPKAKTPAPAPAPKAVEPAPKAEDDDESGLNQDDIDAVFASLDSANAEEPAAEEEPGDVLELTDEMSDWDAAAAEEEAGKAGKAGKAEVSPELVDPPEVVFEEASTEVPEPEMAEPEPEPARAPAAAAAPAPKAPAPASARSFDATESLLSPVTDAVVSSAFGSLANTILSQNPRTIEDLVTDMLRPMLKTWLDDNLPVLVERMVRAEIERVSRGRG